MNPDEPDYFCARCFSRLPRGNCEETFCDACDAPIWNSDAYLTAAQLMVRKIEDEHKWAEAEASGLILPPRAGG